MVNNSINFNSLRIRYENEIDDLNRAIKWMLMTILSKFILNIRKIKLKYLEVMYKIISFIFNIKINLIN